MTIKTNQDVLQARLMERFDDMDPTDLITLWNENSDSRIESIDDIGDHYESAFGSDMTGFLNAVYRGNSIDAWPGANYFTVNDNGNLIFLQDYDAADSPFDAEVLAGKLLDNCDPLVDEVRDDLIDESRADPEAWDDAAGVTSPAVYLCGLNALIPTSADAARAMAQDFTAWKAGHTLTTGETDSFRSFFREVAKGTGLYDEFTAIGIV